MLWYVALLGLLHLSMLIHFFLLKNLRMWGTNFLKGDSCQVVKMAEIPSQSKPLVQMFKAKLWKSFSYTLSCSLVSLQETCFCKSIVTSCLEMAWAIMLHTCFQPIDTLPSQISYWKKIMPYRRWYR